MGKRRVLRVAFGVGVGIDWMAKVKATSRAL